MEPVSLRDARSPVPAAGVGRGERWAVVVGISAYRDPRLNLRFAARDATELAAVLTSPTGGAFPEGHIRRLVDGEATSREVIRALRGFLTRPAPEDLVLLYFACHGGPDPRRPNGPLYLLTHDTEPDDIGSTAVPMDEIHGALRNVLLAERVVVLADTCHSAALGGPGRRSASSAEATNVYLARLAEAKAGVALLTSCEAAESSQEDERWGKGHGVFTWHLLQGMRGAADGFGRARDGIVGLGELFDYVRERVQADTGGQQHPSVGTSSFDRDLPMAVTSDIDVRRHLDLSRALVELGRLTDDQAAFALAARESESATELARLTGRALPEAAALRAEALLAGRQAAQAVEVLAGTDLDAVPAAGLLRGVALAESGHPQEAAAALTRFATRFPDDDEAAWAADYAAALAVAPGGARRALLIGAGTYRYPNINLPGASNDPVLLAGLLTERAGFAPSDTRLLVDASATRAAVLDALDDLSRCCEPQDTVVVSYSGHSPSGIAPEDVYLLTHDADAEALRGVTSRELADRLGRVSGHARLLILDTGVSTVFRELMKAHPGWVIVSASGQTVDAMIDGTPNGALTKALAESWPHATDTSVTYGTLVDRTTGWLADHDFSASALLAQGNREALILGAGFPAADLWHLSRLGTFQRYDAPIWAQRFAPMLEYPNALWALGRSQAAGGEAEAAVEALDQAVARLGSSRPALMLDRAGALLEAGRHGDAEATVQACAALPQVATDEAAADIVAAASRAIQALRSARGRALVVGIDNYADPTITPPTGARADAESFASAIAAAACLADDEVVVLLDEQATRERILAEFDLLAEHGTEALAVFSFAGVGSWTTDGRQCLVAHDGRLPAGPHSVPDIAMADLAARAAAAPNLIAIIDAGGVPGSVASTSTQPVPGTRTAPPAEGRLGGDPDVVGTREESVVGVVSIIPAVPHRSKDARLETATSPTGVVRGRLTAALERSLSKARHRNQLTYAGWVQSRDLRGRARVQGPAADEPVLRHRTALYAARQASRGLARRAASTCLAMATTGLEDSALRGDQNPRMRLVLGLAHDALGQHAAAIVALRTARNLLEDDNAPLDQQEADPGAREWRRWACHHLGRLLYQHGGEAVAALRAASALDPQDVSTDYHLANAIKTLVERESLVDVASMLHRYLNGGAPLGHVAEVQALLRTIGRR